MGYKEFAESRFQNWTVTGTGPLALFYPTERKIVLCEDEAGADIAQEFLGPERNVIRLDEEAPNKPAEGFV
jgi:hypothetical protein